MFDFVPISYYYQFYLNMSLVIVIISLLHAFILPITDKKNINYIKVIGTLYFLVILFFVGLRPVNWRFVDMVTYNDIYIGYMHGASIFTTEDILFHYFMKFCSYIMNPKAFFFICSFLYIFPMYRISVKLFKEYWFYAFLVFVVSFSFWSYGTNGIRNGVATSLFLWAISCYPNKFWLVFLMFLATQIHKTLLLPVAAFAITYYYSNSKTYLLFWSLCIPLSIALGGFWESLFSSLGFGNEKLGAYLVGGNVNNDSFKSTGFRYDFLIYSATAVFTGWYFIFKKKYTDILYIRLFNTYLACNAFWILVIRANFSNRFAYLSWFMIGLIIIYPFLKKEFFINHHIKVGKVFTAYFLFTFLMYYIYYND